MILGLGFRMILGLGFRVLWGLGFDTILGLGFRVHWGLGIGVKGWGLRGRMGNGFQYLNAPMDRGCNYSKRTTTFKKNSLHKCKAVPRRAYI